MQHKVMELEAWQASSAAQVSAEAIAAGIDLPTSSKGGVEEDSTKPTDIQALRVGELSQNIRGGAEFQKTMNGSRETRTRWKRKNAAETARGDPISVMYETMKDWEAPRGLFADSGVLLQVDGKQAQLLSRACFGRFYPLAVQPASSVSTYPPPVPEEGMQLIQLGLEEAFFLNYELKCIEIYSQTPNGRIKLNYEDLWRLMKRSKKQFVHYYKAYSHLRSKRWVVLSGIQYGADFMAYRHHPALVHSDYAVLVMIGERKQERLSTWTDLHSMQRLCGSVAKTLLLLHVTPEDANIESKFPICLDIYNVEAVEVERWIPEKHREDVGLEEKMS